MGTVPERMPTAMTKLSRLLLLIGLAWVSVSAQPLRADCRGTAILENANAVLSELAAIPLKKIPPALLRNAQGVAIFPGLIKAAVVVGGRHGRGVLLTRGADGSWSPPVFLTLSGASFGHQLGVEGSDLVLVFRTRSSLDCMKKGKITLGADVMVAAGPIGREVDLSTDVFLKTGIFSYSRSKGLFAGACVEGSVLLIDAAATAAYRHCEQDCVQNGGSTGPGVPPALRLQMKLAELSATPPTPNVMAPFSGAPSVSPHP